MIIRSVVVGPLQVNCYIVADKISKEAVVIDPGDEPELILDLIRKHGLSIRYILCTHGHFDHVGAVSDIKEVAHVPVLIHQEDLFLYEAASTAGTMWGFEVSPQPKPDSYLKEGDTIRFGTSSLTVMHTPGHSPGSVCLFGDGQLISGDTLFAGSIGRSDLPGGNLGRLKESFRRLMALPEATGVLPGHGPSSSIGEERRENIFAGELLL
ncbi:MAG TPA: MBL fold metallo-hydrolase [Dissulfurispiraceae bacterium]|nr:MBL fold metallo-hydrolase [Dissulfurispiraceae bacterium]